MLLPEMSDLVVCKNRVCHCGGKAWGCGACITYPGKCNKQRSKLERFETSPPLCDECLQYLRRKPCAICASGAICSSSPVQDLESAVEALSFAVANLVHAARMCAPPPPLQQAGPGSSSDATPAPIAAECVAAQALFPSEREKAAGKSAGKGAGMDAARTAAVGGATAADAAEEGASTGCGCASGTSTILGSASWARRRSCTVSRRLVQ